MKLPYLAPAALPLMASGYLPAGNHAKFNLVFILTALLLAPLTALLASETCSPL